jgi:hypothetical protein
VSPTPLQIIDKCRYGLCYGTAILRYRSDFLETVGAAIMTRIRIMGVRLFSSYIVSGVVCLSWVLGGYAHAAGGSLLDNALDQVNATGTSTYSVSGNVDNNCTLTDSANSICLGTYIWTDDHSNDASTNKGAMIMNGNVQQNLVSNINISSTVSPVSASANIVSNVTPAPNSTINLSNSANSTGFIGGY